MKHICPVCQKTSLDGNLWCDKPGCPSGHMPVLMDRGDSFGNIQIVGVRRVMRAATLYDAECEGQPVLLKVARRRYENYLLREIAMLNRITGNPPDSTKTFPNTPFPHMLSSGTSVFRGETLYYVTFEAVAGDFLCDLLLQNPEPWYRNVGWFIQQLAAAMRDYHAYEVLHLALTPENILVHQDDLGTWMPVLMSLGATLSIHSHQPVSLEADIENQADWHDTVNPAYASPSLLNARLNARILTIEDDIYQMKLLLYEMLAGKPAFQDEKHGDEIPKIERLDAPELADFLNERVNAKVNTDQDYDDLYHELQVIVGPRPVSVPGWKIWKRDGIYKRIFLAAVIGVIIIIVFVVVLLILQL